MMRNDYRRSLILLRNNVSGYSGHVRLERRTLTGSMAIVAQTPPDAGRLEAALVGHGRCGTYACPMGRLRRDGRGQAVLNWTFDPRDICARTLEDYELIVISEVTDSACGVALFGNVDGHAELDWREARDVLCRLYGAAGLEQPSPRQGEISSPNEPLHQRQGEMPAPNDAKRPRQGEVPSPRSRQSEAPLPNDSSDLPSDGSAAMIEEAPQQTEIIPQESVIGEIPPEAELPETAALIEKTEPLPEAAALIEESEPISPAQPTAGEILGLDMTLPWPETVEALRQAFREQPPVQNAPDETYVYVSLPMPAEIGGEMLAGVRAENGVPAAVSYAIPAPWSAEPPAGLEDYTWAGDQNAGWWVAEADVRMGQRL